MRRSLRGATETRGHGETRFFKTPCLCVSVARDREWRSAWLVLASFMLWLSPVSAQQLLDRVLARIDGAPLTLTDVQAAIGLGVVQVPPGADAMAAGTQLMIDRQLELTEVQRFPPPEPDATPVARAAARRWSSGFATCGVERTWRSINSWQRAAGSWQQAAGSR